MQRMPGLDQPAVYRIQVQGVLPSEWEVWFNGMQLEDDGCITTLQGPVPDQPALFGVLIKIRDLGLTLLSVQRLDEVFAYRCQEKKLDGNFPGRPHPLLYHLAEATPEYCDHFA